MCKKLFLLSLFVSSIFAMEPKYKKMKPNFSIGGDKEMTPLSFSLLNTIISDPNFDKKRATLQVQKLSATDSCYLSEKQRCHLIRKCINAGGTPCLDIYGKLLGKNATLRRAVDAEDVQLATDIMTCFNRKDQLQATHEYETNKFIKHTPEMDALFEKAKIAAEQSA